MKIITYHKTRESVTLKSKMENVAENNGHHKVISMLSMHTIAISKAYRHELVTVCDTVGPHSIFEYLHKICQVGHGGDLFLHHGDDSEGHTD